MVRKGLTNKQKTSIFGLVCVLIPLIAYAFFHAFPMIVSLVLMFVDSNGSYKFYDMTWNNFANFKSVFSTDLIWQATKVSLFTTLAHLTSLVIATLTANFLRPRYKGSTFFEVLYFIPHICSTVALAIMFKWLFNPDQGVINSLLVALGGKPIDWYYDEAAYPWMLFSVILWSSPGYGIVMYKSVFSAINPAVYEAADIDGATGWTRFWKITFPELIPMFCYLLMLGIVAGMQTFEIAKVIRTSTGGLDIYGPNNSGLTLMCYIYKEYSNMHLGNAAVLSWYLFVIVFVLSFFANKFKSKMEAER